MCQVFLVPYAPLGGLQRFFAKHLFSPRLASAFEKRLKQDQRRVENTIEFNTPTDIEKDFSDFFDGERIDVCDVIESILHSEDVEEEIDVEIYYQRLACIIFVVRCYYF